MVESSTKIPKVEIRQWSKYINDNNQILQLGEKLGVYLEKREENVVE